MSQTAVVEPPIIDDTKNKSDAHVVNEIDPPSGKHLSTTEERDADLSNLFKVGAKEPAAKQEEIQDPPPVNDPPAPKQEIPEPKTPVVEPPKAETTPPITSEVDSPELKSLLEAPIPTKNPKTAQEMEAYKGKWAGHVRTLEKKVKAVEKDLQVAQTDLAGKLKEYEKQIEELSGYRLAVDFQADPKFVEKYEAPLNEKKGEIKDFLKQNGVSDGGIQHLESVWDNQVALLAIANQLGEQSSEVGELFRDHLRDLRGVQKNHSKAVREAVTKRGDLIKERRESSTRETAEREAGFQNRFQELISLKNGEGPGAPPKFDFLHKKAVPPGASAQQIKAIEAHNRTADEENGMIHSMARTTDAQSLMDMAVLSRLVPRLVVMFQNAEKEAREANEKLAEINKSGSFTQKGTKGSGGSGAPPPKPGPGETPSGGEVFDAQFKGTFK